MKWSKIFLGIVVFIFVISGGFFSQYYLMQIFYSGQHQEVFDFLNIPFYSPDNIEFLGENAALHMHDVKILFNAFFVLFITSLAILAVYFKEAKEGRTLRYTGIAILIAVGIDILTAAIIGFKGCWHIFHKIFFPQGNYIFPENSIIIQLFPNVFFMRFIIIFEFIVAAAGTILIFLDKFKYLLNKKKE